MIYEELHPETKAGQSQANAMNKAIGNVSANIAPTFTANTASATGKSERAVELDAERGKKVIGEDPRIVQLFVITRPIKRRGGEDGGKQSNRFNNIQSYQGIKKIKWRTERHSTVCYYANKSMA